jgi:hypothetical protein
VRLSWTTQLIAAEEQKQSTAWSGSAHDQRRDCPDPHGAAYCVGRDNGPVGHDEECAEPFHGAHVSRTHVPYTTW